MSRLSKIQSYKQQKRYKNETMNVLNNCNYRANTPNLFDKSLNSFKNIKPQVQSSRLSRPDYGKIYGKIGINIHNNYSREKDKALIINEKISSKSLQSKQSGSHNTHRKEADHAKKNSYSRLLTEGVCNNSKNIEVCQLNAQQRLRNISNIFVDNYLQNSHSIQNLTQIQSPSIMQLKKKLSNLSFTKQNTNSKQSISKNNSKIMKNASQMIYQLKAKFQKFQNEQQQRKKNLKFDDLDEILTRIFKSIKTQFIFVIDTLLKEDQQKMLNIEMSVTKIITDFQDEIEKQIQKQQIIKQSYSQQIQTLLIRSLYLTDKINILQETGVFHFEKQARFIDNDQSSQEVQAIERGQQNININYEKNESEKEDQFNSSISSQLFIYNPPLQQPLHFINQISQSYRQKTAWQNKYNAQNSIKNIR